MVDESYVDVLGLKIVAGRNFSTEFPTDSTAYLINQSAAAAIGWTSNLQLWRNSWEPDNPFVPAMPGKGGPMVRVE